MVLLIEAGILLAILFGTIWFVATNIRRFGLEKAVKHSLLVTFPLVFFGWSSDLYSGIGLGSPDTNSHAMGTLISL